MEDLAELVDRADPDRLLVAVDALCAAREWDGLAELADRCRAAVELGRQLWGVAMHIDYRLALEGPAEHAAAVLGPGSGRFTLGPLTEVAASTHTFQALAPHLGDPVIAGTVAQERVIRREDLAGLTLQIPADLPLHTPAWEPDYALPVYRDRSAKFPQPVAATRNLPPAEDLDAGDELADDASEALLEVVGTWTSQSEGRAAAVAVSGHARRAVGCFATRASLLEVGAADGLALLQWAGASGGAHGRRRGGAAGRFTTWWAAAALTGLDWPPDPDELGEAVAELRWFRWAPEEAETGWVLRLAVEDPLDGLAWAIDATDAVDDELSGPSTPEDASR